MLLWGLLASSYLYMYAYMYNTEKKYDKKVCF